MKRKFLLSAFLFASTLRGYAQDARGAMNQILDGYTLPIFAACMLVGLALGVAQQLDNIIDKENREHAGTACLPWAGMWVSPCLRES
ncbi:hypothetical protein NXX67_10220 [Bacteroides fragilis]|nr:hypothetical protein NXX67_10220 [Bacteroides fragilis]